LLRKPADNISRRVKTKSFYNNDHLLSWCLAGDKGVWQRIRAPSSMEADGILWDLYPTMRSQDNTNYMRYLEYGTYPAPFRFLYNKIRGEMSDKEAEKELWIAKQLQRGENTGTGRQCAYLDRVIAFHHASIVVQKALHELASRSRPKAACELILNETVRGRESALAYARRHAWKSKNTAQLKYKKAEFSRHDERLSFARESARVGKWASSIVG